MNSTSLPVFSYLLVDGALAGDVVDDLVLAGPDKPGWIYSPYPDEAVQLGPIVIDIAAAVEAEAIDAMMVLVNAVSPQLHLSIIETHLTAPALTEHLRRFIVVRNEAYKTYSLRFADCIVQATLSVVLRPPQWAAFTCPFVKWHTHGRDGRLISLPIPAAGSENSPAPLILDIEQFGQCADACEPDVYIAHIKAMRHGGTLRGSCQEQYLWACKSRDLWRASANSEDVVLRWLVAAAIDTAGEALEIANLSRLLSEKNLDEIRKIMANVVAVHAHKA